MRIPRVSASSAVTGAAINAQVVEPSLEGLSVRLITHLERERRYESEQLKLSFSTSVIAGLPST